MTYHSISRLTGALGVCAAVAIARPAHSEPRAVVELFTSQGCSSCPAADKVLGDLAKDPNVAKAGNGMVITTFVFRVRNVPAALYKALGGFATNGVNMTKLESYQLNGHFFATQFYADVEGHPEDRPLKLALEELAFFSTEVKILGVYPACDWRKGRAE